MSELHRQQARERAKQWYWDNREYSRAKSAQWRLANHDKIVAFNRARRQWARAYARDYRSAHGPAIREYRHKYYWLNRNYFVRKAKEHRKTRRSFFQWLAFTWKAEKALTSMKGDMSMITTLTPGRKPKSKEFEQIREEMKVWKTSRLKRYFAHGMRMIREHLLRMASALELLDERDEKIEADKNILKLLRDIYKGRLAVDVVVRFAGRPVTMASIAGLPKSEQEKLLELSDDEVEEKFRKPHEHETDLERLGKAFRSGSVKDLADMCVELIRMSPDPAELSALLIPKLEKLKRRAL